jgi:hypothetical protein
VQLDIEEEGEKEADAAEAATAEESAVEPSREGSFVFFWEVCGRGEKAGGSSRDFWKARRKILDTLHF